jgi:hypothetical protein
MPKKRLVGLNCTAGPEINPVPESTMLCAPALSAMLMAELLAPAAVGLNVTLMAHAAPGATLVPHVLLCRKSATFAPVNVIEEMVRVPFPVLVSVTA